MASWDETRRDEMSCWVKVGAANAMLFSTRTQAAAKDWQSNAKFQTLSRVSRSCARIGWYQGSGFMFISGAFLRLCRRPTWALPLRESSKEKGTK